MNKWFWRINLVLAALIVLFGGLQTAIFLMNMADTTANVGGLFVLPASVFLSLSIGVKGWNLVK